MQEFEIGNGVLLRGSNMSARIISIDKNERTGTKVYSVVVLGTKEKLIVYEDDLIDARHILID